MRSGVSARALLLVLASAWLSGGWLPGNRLADTTRKGNRAYEEGSYDEALRQYTAAQEFAKPDDPRLLFNIGTVLARQKKGEEAVKSFERAGRSAAPLLASRAFYNQGNAYYGMEKWKEAVTAYQEALLRNPADADAKRNLELALRKLREQEQEQRDRQEQGEQGNRQDREKDEEKKPQQGKEAPKPEEDQKEEKEPQAGQQKPQDPQKDEMDRLLRMVQEEEKKALREERTEAEASSPKPTRDW